MDSPIGVLFETQLRRWISAKGFWLILGVALLPALFSGAWALTHTDDVAVTNLSYSPTNPVADDVINATTRIENVGDSEVGEFNVTLQVERVSRNPQTGQVDYNGVHQNVTRVGPLDAGESVEATTSWSGGLSPGQGVSPGYYRLGAVADSDDEIGDRELSNDFRFAAFTVRVPPPQTSPDPPDDLGGNATSANAADVVVQNLSTPSELEAPVGNVTLTATVENRGPTTLESANVTVQVKTESRGVLQVVPTLRRTVEVTNLEPNETRTVSVGPAPISQSIRGEIGGYWAEAYADVGDTNNDPNPDDNYRNASFTVQPPILEGSSPDPKEDQTIRTAYKVLLEFLHLPLVLPLVGLYYAGGLIGDERREGTLPYLLTRPLERWLLPASKFLAGFLVSVVAVSIGVLATYVFVIALSDAGGIAFLTAPLALSILSLFTYGALFTLLATLVDRPYLIGLAFVLGWEVIVGNLVPWVENLTVSFHLGNLLNAWWDAEALVFKSAPAWGDTWKPLAVLVGAGIGFLLLAGFAMRHREFPDA